MTKDHEERADIVRRLDGEKRSAGERTPTKENKATREEKDAKEGRGAKGEEAAAAAAILAAVNLVQHLSKNPTRNVDQSPNAGRRAPPESRNWFLDLLGYKAWIPERSTIRDQRRSRWSSLDAGSELYQSIREFAEKLREYSATEEDRQCARLILRYSKHLSRAIERVLGPEHKGFELRNNYTPEERLEILTFFFQTLKMIRQGDQNDAQRKGGATGGRDSTELGIPPKVVLDLQNRLRTFIIKDHSRQLASNASNRAQSLPELLDRWLCPLFKLGWEPGIRPGRRRVRYECECGMQLHEDFTNVDSSNNITLNPEEPIFPESSLNHPADQRRTPSLLSTVSETDFTERPGEPIDDVGPSRKNDEQQVTGKNNKVDDSRSNNSHTHQEKDLLHLLICIIPGNKRRKKIFFQERLPLMANDKDFFGFLHQTYYRRRDVWWTSPWSVSKVGHCRVELQFDTIVSVDEHPISCPLQQRCQRWPPVSLIGLEYRCNPGARNVDTHIGPAVLAHYFSNPHHSALEKSKHRILDSVSKKIDPPLSVHGEVTVTGWGIYIEEGWHIPTCVILTIFILLALFGTVFT